MATAAREHRLRPTSLGRKDEAEQAYLATVFSKEGATVAYVHLAVLCGRQRRFSEARDWPRRIRDDEKADPPLVEQATELDAMLDDIESGRQRHPSKWHARRRSRRSAVDASGASRDQNIAISPTNSAEEPINMGSIGIQDGRRW